MSVMSGMFRARTGRFSRTACFLSVGEGTTRKGLRSRSTALCQKRASKRGDGHTRCQNGLDGESILQ